MLFCMHGIGVKYPAADSVAAFLSCWDGTVFACNDQMRYEYLHWAEHRESSYRH